ncbi:MAG: PTS lactose/cellobiose transporter subunit IIA, partial [Chloroflexi bacterium]|nr:PTS lactose/cellobiose transporter subunit IIA [Chloroflexota bacterium]
MNKDLEKYCFELISYAGEARSLVFEALNEAKDGNIAKAKELIGESRKPGVEAHRIQMQLLTLEARGEDPGASVLLVHAQDLLMASTTERDLGEFIIDLMERSLT